MKISLLIFLLSVSSFTFSQYNNWAAVKVYGTNDIGKIYIGSNLVWEKDSYDLQYYDKVEIIVTYVDFVSCTDRTLDNDTDIAAFLSSLEAGCEVNSATIVYGWYSNDAAHPYLLAGDVNGPFDELLYGGGDFPVVYSRCAIVDPPDAYNGIVIYVGDIIDGEFEFANAVRFIPYVSSCWWD